MCFLQPFRIVALPSVSCPEPSTSVPLIFATFGNLAAPLRSPDNWIVPSADGLAGPLGGLYDI